MAFLLLHNYTDFIKYCTEKTHCSFSGRAIGGTDHDVRRKDI